MKRASIFLTAVIQMAAMSFAQPVEGPYFVQQSDSGSISDVRMVMRDDSTAEIFYTVAMPDSSVRLYHRAYSLSRHAPIGGPQALYAQHGWSAGIDGLVATPSGWWNCVIEAVETHCDTCRMRAYMSTGFGGVIGFQQIFEGTVPTYTSTSARFLSGCRLISRPAGGVHLIGNLRYRQGLTGWDHPLVMSFPAGYATPDLQYEYVGADSTLSRSVTGAALTVDDRVFVTLAEDTLLYSTTLPPRIEEPQLTPVTCSFTERTRGGRLLGMWFNEMRGGAAFIDITEFEASGDCNRLAYYTPSCPPFYGAFHARFGWAVLALDYNGFLLARLDTNGAVVQPFGPLFTVERGHYVDRINGAIASGGRVVFVWTETNGSGPPEIKIAGVGWNTPLGADDRQVRRPEADTRGIAGFPNPFNAQTTISFEVARAGSVSLDVFDLLGRHVETLARGNYSAGLHRVTLDGRMLASGVYFCRIKAGDVAVTKKLLLMK